VTGVTGGVGEAIATRLTATGAQVFLVARTREYGSAAVARIRARTPEADLDVVAADLSEMAQVRALTEQLQQATAQLDALILNAAEARSGRQLTGERLESNVATNYLSAKTWQYGAAIPSGSILEAH
jgi:NAD(P)-dependent dehydrogenase (short-subunit alcohol dehydrogenase family)